ncbi:unnamed protein product [Linum trigynum]|uniref:RNase H type-1 domain-containing protein n=1 Tax=Linum trigynum TaxID=586398 RepID=A0AAV2FA58_9ROSI
MIMFNWAREVLLAKGIQFQLIDDPMVVELLVLCEAILWCLDLGFTYVIFEGDGKVIIDKVNRADARDNRMGVVLEEIVHYLAAHPGFSIRFVGHGSNRVAHLVARKALSLYLYMSRFFDFQTWLNSRI